MQVIFVALVRMRSHNYAVGRICTCGKRSYVGYNEIHSSVIQYTFINTTIFFNLLFLSAIFKVYLIKQHKRQLDKYDKKKKLLLKI